jgi:ACS family hexuronate transporter-like MFS transporter
MTDLSPAVSAARGSVWKWWVCGLLLLATMLNYMDRLTLNLTANRVMTELQLDERHYGQLESAFAFAFAVGAILMGWLADRYEVRCIYPVVVVAWSAAGLLTGLTQGFVGLLMCRFLLGFTEAGHWPCALKTTQQIMPPHQRSLGNSILQSGAALGAIFTPLIVTALVLEGDRGKQPGWVAGVVAAPPGAGPGVAFPGTLTAALAPVYEPGAWRSPFIVVGAIGMTWALLWLVSVRRGDLAGASRVASSLMRVVGWLAALLALDVVSQLTKVSHPAAVMAVKLVVAGLGIAGVAQWLFLSTAGDSRDEPLSRRTFVRRFWVLVILVVSINIAWHYFRAWMPLFLQKEHHFGEARTYGFTLAYYVATDAGSLTVGFVTLFLARRGMTVHASRVVVFVACALLTALSVAAAMTRSEVVLMGLLLVIGFAALGLFPNYYSFSQELTVRNQGKVTGALGCINWLAMYALHAGVGESVKQTGSYAMGVALAGLAPLVGVGALLLLWGKGK